MQPVLYDFHAPLFGEVSFPAYFTLLTIGFAIAIWITYREAPRIGLDRELVLDNDLWMVVWGIIGARVLHLIADGHFHEYVDLCLDPRKVPAIDALVARCTSDAQCGYDYLCDLANNTCHPPRDCLAAVKVWRGGLAYYGGFIFATAFAIRFLHRHRMNVLRVCDLAAPTIALGLFFGRIGCFLNGCCYGKESDSPLALSFPRYSPVWRAQLDAGLINTDQAPLAVHPTQLYEAAGCLLIFIVLYFVVRPYKRRDGQVIAWLLILYAIARSAVEILRDDDRGVLFGFLSTSQLLSLPLAAAGVYLLLRLRRPVVTPPSG
ncbi:MAG TPA: prolipoprotein diacylglyceryl transferase [Polyangia bacterium]|nr:prolipoprotein diacylglyceryl transferase [Polyangia bacterium]